MIMASRRRFVAAGTAAALAGCARGPGALQPRRADLVTVDGSVPTEWDVGRPEAHGFSAPALAAVLADGEATPGLRALVVVRDGALVAEGYWRDTTAQTLLPIASATKSVSSMLVGIALARGRLGSVDRRIAELLPDAAAALPEATTGDVTLAQILAGRSGFAFDWKDSPELAVTPDPVRFALTLPRRPAPPSGWTYNDPLVGLIAPVLMRSEGVDLAEFAQRELFAPLGIAQFAWRRDRQSRPMSYGGLALRPRDLAKLAWTMAAGGVWNGRAVVPAGWVDSSTARHGPADWRLPPIENLGYGDLWFNGTLGGRRVVWAWGYGGQFALIAPQQRLVVATAAQAPRIAQLEAQTQAIAASVARVIEAAA